MTSPKQVADIMTAPVEQVGTDISGESAAALMAQKHINHVVVVDEDGVVAGVLSDRDLRNAQPSTLLVRDPEMRNKALSLLKVGDIMSLAPGSWPPACPHGTPCAPCSPTRSVRSQWSMRAAAPWASSRALTCSSCVFS